jgi:ADYC domain-containing protein
MRSTMNAVWLFVCACGTEPSTASVEQAGMNMQGMNMQGMNMQGMNMQGMNMQGFELGNATLHGNHLANVRVENGELVADRGALTLHGALLVGTHLTAQAVSAADPSIIVEVKYRITAVTPENPAYDPTHTGATYLYTLEQFVDDTGSWQPACGPDVDGLGVAIPIAAIFDAQGNRVESDSLFTFGCTTGVIAKCYRWGYRPWVTGYGDLVDMHWTCTRLARADYCGDGTPHTHDGTWVNVWDDLPPPGPIQNHGLLTPLGMVFEAGWNHSGAVCLSHARWLLDDTLANLCPDRLVPPGLLGATVCDSVADVLGYDPDASLFDESYLNL